MVGRDARPRFLATSGESPGIRALWRLALIVTLWPGAAGRKSRH